MRERPNAASMVATKQAVASHPNRSKSICDCKIGERPTGVRLVHESSIPHTSERHKSGLHRSHRTLGVSTNEMNELGEERGRRGRPQSIGSTWTNLRRSSDKISANGDRTWCISSISFPLLDTRSLSPGVEGGEGTSGVGDRVLGSPWRPRRVECWCWRR